METLKLIELRAICFKFKRNTDAKPVYAGLCCLAKLPIIMETENKQKTYHEKMQVKGIYDH